MEEPSIISRKNEARSLFKKCFKNPIFSLVPFEIWRDLIVSNADLQTVAFLSQTCWGFKELVDNFGENNFNLARGFRREGQAHLARRYLQLCANNNNSTAMFHLGEALSCSGWGIKKNLKIAPHWFKKSGELGNGCGMAFYAKCLVDRSAGERNEGLSNVWAQKALTSNDFFAMGYCHFFGLGTKEDFSKSFAVLEVSANEGNELAQEWLGFCFLNGKGTDPCTKTAFNWYVKSAEQGLSMAQSKLGSMYDVGEGCEKDEQKAIMWIKKAARQGDDICKNALKNRGVSLLF